MHLRTNIVPNDAHIFSYRSPQGLKSLTKPMFLQRCNEIWQPLGYPRTMGHCFRIGGTTELLLAGIPPEVVGPHILFSVIGDHLMILPLIISVIYILSSIGTGVVRRPPLGASRWHAIGWAVAIWG